ARPNSARATQIGAPGALRRPVGAARPTIERTPAGLSRGCNDRRRLPQLLRRRPHCLTVLRGGAVLCALAAGPARHHLPHSLPPPSVPCSRVLRERPYRGSAGLGSRATRWQPTSLVEGPPSRRRLTRWSRAFRVS